MGCGNSKRNKPVDSIKDTSIDKRKEKTDKKEADKKQAIEQDLNLEVQKEENVQELGEKENQQQISESVQFHDVSEKQQIKSENSKTGKQSLQIEVQGQKQLDESSNIQTSRQQNTNQEFDETKSFDKQHQMIESQELLKRIEVEPNPQEEQAINITEEMAQPEEPSSLKKSIKTELLSKLKEEKAEEEYSQDILDIKVEPQQVVFEDERLNLKDKTRTKNLQPQNIQFSTKEGLSQSQQWEPTIITKKHIVKGTQEEHMFESYDRSPFEKKEFKPQEPNEILLSQQKIEQLRQEFLNRQEAFDKDPLFMKVKLAFVIDGPDGIGRRVYCFYVRKMIGTVKDLKNEIKIDFGYQLEQQKIFRNYKEVGNDQIFSNIEEYDNQNEVLLFVPTETPKNPPKIHFRTFISEISVGDIMQINCSMITKQDFENYNFRESLMWPPFRDYTSELFELQKKIHKAQGLVKKEVSSIETQEMADLMKAEKTLKELVDDFAFTALKAVNIIEHWKPDPVYLGNIYGKGGKKYVTGGLIIRECKNWFFNGQLIQEGDLSYRIAQHEYQNLNLLQGLDESFSVPLVCMVNVVGARYLVQTLAPISHKSIVYGSNTECLFIEKNEQETVIAKKIALEFNQKEHLVWNRISQTPSKLWLPYDVEIHRLSNQQNYVLNVGRLMPPDIFGQQNTNEVNGKMHLFQLVQNNTHGQVKEEYKLFTWLHPQKCSECGYFIDDFDYYYYEKRNFDKQQTLLMQYFCCINCYNELKTGNMLKIAINHIKKKTLPEKERGIFWRNLETMQEIPEDEIPFVKVPLNSDAFNSYQDNIEDEEIKQQIYLDQKEISDLGLKLQDEVIPTFFKEMEELEICPKNSEELNFFMKQRGINLRYLGRMATECEYNFLKELAVREILALSIKVLVRDGLSFLRDEPNGYTMEDVKKCVLHYLNEILTLEERASSKQLWSFVTDLIRSKFGITLEKDIIQNINLPSFMITVCQHLNVKIRSYKGIDITLENPIGFDEITSIEPKLMVQNNYMSSVQTALLRARKLDGIGRKSK